MAVVMIALVIGWLRDAETRHTEEPGWLEQARRATFAGHTGTEPAGSTDPAAAAFDDDDAARASYNAWLDQLDRQG